MLSLARLITKLGGLENNLRGVVDDSTLLKDNVILSNKILEERRKLLQKIKRAQDTAIAYSHPFKNKVVVSLHLEAIKLYLYLVPQHDNIQLHQKSSFFPPNILLLISLCFISIFNFISTTRFYK